MPGPMIARPVFASEDFGLLRKAVHEYLLRHADDADSAKYSNLYHRLGRPERAGSSQRRTPAASPDAGNDKEPQS